MAAVDERLVRRDGRLILLFTPPFDQGTLQPGYIKGYVPGIRENGGQYTHAATWVVLATALLGRGDRRAWSCSTCSTRSTTPTTPDGRRALQGRAVRRGGRRLRPARRTPAAAAGPGTPARPPGSTASAWKRSSASGSGATRLLLDPCIPGDWPGFEITYRHRSTTYHIAVENPDGVERGVRALTLDGQPLDGDAVDLADDGQVHEVRVTMGARPSPTPPTGDRPEDA